MTKSTKKLLIGAAVAAGVGGAIYYYTKPEPKKKTLGETGVTNKLGPKLYEWAKEQEND